MGPLISVLIRFVFISWNFLSVWGLSWKEALSGWFLDHWGLDCSGPSDLFIWGAYSPLLLERAKPLPVSTAGLILANCSWVCQAPQLLPQDFSPQADSMQVTWLLVVVLHSLPFGGHHLVCVNTVPQDLVLFSACSVFLWRDLGRSQNYAATDTTTFPESSSVAPLLVSPEWAFCKLNNALGYIPPSYFLALKYGTDILII